MNPEYLTNRLHFLSNEKTILAFLKSGKRAGVGEPLFSLATIVPQPEALLKLPLNEQVVSLSMMNMEAPPLDEATRRVAVSRLFEGRKENLSEADIDAKIDETRKHAAALADDRLARIVDQAVSNYRELGFFSLHDWRFKHWGTVEDIRSATASTFDLPTSFIEFTTRWTPPIAAMRALAEIFPSVRFELEYRLDAQEPWTRTEIFPARTFAY